MTTPEAAPSAAESVPESALADDEKLPPDPRRDPAATVDALERRIERQEGNPEAAAGPPAPAEEGEDVDEPPD